MPQFKLSHDIYRDTQELPEQEQAGQASPLPGPRDVLVGYLEAFLANGQKEFVQILQNEEFFVGREPSCKVVIMDPFCSNWHFRIYSILFERNSQPLVYCQDLSMNGTSFNGRPIGKKNSVLLSENDTLEIRRAATFVFHPLNCGNQVTHDLSYIESDAYLFSGTYTVTNRMLGAGGFGVVLLAREERTQRQIACKVVNLRSKKLKRGNIKEMLMKEVQILMGLSHPNIINIHKVYSTPDRIYIFEDLITGGDLWSHIERKGQIEEIEAIPILWQLIEALGFLHEHGIAHRDLKPDNILLTSSEHGARIVLADFGAAKQAPPGTRMLTFVGTVEYTAPEITARQGNPAASGYDHSVDLWSVGVILYMMLAGQQPFALNGTGPTENKNVHDRALRCDLSSLEADPIWAEVSDYAKDLIRNLIVVDADGRLDVSVIRRHPWFSRYTDDLVPLYYRAIAEWRERTEPVEWIDVQEAESGKIVTRKYGQGHEVVTYYQYAQRRPALTQLQPNAIEEEDDHKHQGHYGIESSISRFRIGSDAEVVESTYKGEMDIVKESIDADDEAELHHLVSSEQKGWKSAKEFAQELKERRRNKNRNTSGQKQEWYIDETGKKTLRRDLSSY